VKGISGDLIGDALPPACDVLPPVTTGDYVGGGWNQYYQCRDLHQAAIDELQKTNSPLGSNYGEDGASWKDWAKTSLWFIPGMTPLAAIVNESSTDKGKTAFERVAGDVLDAGFGAVEKIIKTVTAKTTTNMKAVIKIGSGLALGNKLEAVSGFPLQYCMMAQTYLFQFANPQYIPSQSELDMGFLTDRVSDEDWKCYTKANGNLPDLFKPLRNAKQTKPGVHEAIALYRRGVLQTKEDLTKYLRKLGVIDAPHVDDFLSATEAIPQVDDVIRFMVRDVFDPDVVKKYGLDDEFPQKYTAEAERYGTALGMPRDTAKLQWRAHWRVPSDTALYDMVHRLRPDRPEVLAWDAKAKGLDAKDALNLFGPRPSVFTIDDLKYALKINDNLPSFVQNLTDISFRPITNTDASRMYEIGLINADRMIGYFMDNGHTHESGTQLAEFYKAEKLKRVSNTTGVLTAREVINGYKHGLIDRQTADANLADIIVDQQTRTKALDGADFELKMELLQTRLKSLKKRYLFGEFSTNDLTAFLSQTGMVGDKIPTVALAWEAEKLGRAKEPRVTMLCTWFTKGFITWQDYYERLHRLGYNADDINRIIKTCQSDDAAKRARQARQEAERQRREVKREMAEAKADLAGKLKMLKEQIAEREAYLASLNGKLHA
jgi:hypothetical protein